MKYIRYKIKNVEPLRIADDSTSQSGQTVTLHYIPGTTIRGYIVNKIAESLKGEFEKYKKKLFSAQVAYLNAYLYENEKELIPSPKGFYEDKKMFEGKKEIQNVVIEGEFTEGNKRAGLGRFCYIEDNCICYYNVDTSSDMKILVNKRNPKDKQNVFRNEYITPGHMFVGYIMVKDDLLVDYILEALSEKIILGNARSQGLGKCIITEKKVMDNTFMPYDEYIVTDDAAQYCYMMLLSNTVMRNEFGEYVGLDLKTLEEKMGVKNLRIEYCSTSTVNVKGYNRTWGSKIPSITMYEQGSVFKLKYDGIVPVKNMKKIMQSGIGVRINEGFGRVLFLRDYESVKYKMEGSVTEPEFMSADKHYSDNVILKLIAKNYYRKMIDEEMQKRILNGTDNISARSQVGNVRALLESNRYDAIKGTEIVKDYFEHSSYKEDNKKVQNQKASIKPFMKKIIAILEQPLAKTLEIENIKSVMGVPVENLFSENELQRMKFDYILNLMKYDNRKGE